MWREEEDFAGEEGDGFPCSEIRDVHVLDKEAKSFRSRKDLSLTKFSSALSTLHLKCVGPSQPRASRPELAGSTGLGPSAERSKIQTSIFRP